MDIPSANLLNNYFIYKRFTDKELADAINKIFAEMPKQPLRPNPILWPNKDGLDAINAAMMSKWEVTFRKPSKCPNCGETALDDHCEHCDYPYNT